MLPHHLLLLCGFLALCTAGPLKHFHHSSSGEQRLLRDPMQHAPMVKPKPKTHLDAAPNSVGVLFTTSDDEEVLHIWLPLGERVYTRKHCPSLILTFTVLMACRRLARTSTSPSHSPHNDHDPLDAAEGDTRAPRSRGVPDTSSVQQDDGQSEARGHEYQHHQKR